MIASLLLAFLSAAGVAWLLARSRGRWQVLDIPNARSLHAAPVPRTGGIAILAGLLIGTLTAWVIGGTHLVAWPVAMAIAVLGGVALVDDRHGLGPAPRLLVQLGVATLLLVTLAAPETPVLWQLVAGLFLVWMINLYNFMDGMDGFAGGMAVFGFGSFAVAAWLAGDPALALGCGVVVAAAAGFLLLNFPPARLFMGDSGSTVLGLLAGLVILVADARGVLPWWLGLLVFSPFIVDASVTLARRLWHRERVWEAHKTHYYQRLVEYGWGHRRTVLAEYALMAACGASALLARPLSATAQTVIFAVWAVLYVTLMGRIHRAEQRRNRQP